MSEFSASASNYKWNLLGVEGSPTPSLASPLPPQNLLSVQELIGPGSQWSHLATVLIWERSVAYDGTSRTLTSQLHHYLASNINYWFKHLC